VDPLVSADVDLRDFAYLPVDVVRLRDSGLAVEATGDEFRAAVILWCVAWHQVPATSLPDDDRTLAMYAGFGRDTKGWKRVRTAALRGFSKASDGRLYHPVLAEKASEAWESKLRLRHRRECERIKKSAQRAKIDAVYPTFEEWKAHLIACGSDQWPIVPGDKAGTSEGTKEGRPEHVPRESLPLKGKGKGNGEGKGERDSSLRAPSSLRSDSCADDDENFSLDPDDAPRENGPTRDRFEEFWAVYPKKLGRKPCETKWRTRRLDAMADRIIDDVRRRIVEDGLWLDGFVPNPETYINQDRWNDAIQPRRPNGAVRSDLRPGELPKPRTARLLGSDQ
jgi:hypothetical protein